MPNTPTNENTRNEITIKFGKGLVGKPFTASTGRECVAIKIPNADPADKRPWETVVVAANHVHEDKFGKGVWMKLPAEGKMRVMRSEISGKDADGKNTYTSSSRIISNGELKNMLESYKQRNREPLDSALKQPPVPGAPKPHSAEMSR